MVRGRRRGLAVLIALVGAALVLTLVPSAPAQAKSYPVVPAQLFGMHYHAIARSVPDFRVGSLRLWDTKTYWGTLNPAPGRYNWAPLDKALANAKAAGVRDVQYAFGGTPGWALKRASKKRTGSEYSVDVNGYVAFASALASRYGTRITSYDMWNEGSLKISFQGSSKELAELTIRGSRAIKKANPRAIVLAPSTTYGVWVNRPKWWKDVTKRLRRAGWPVDAVNIHPYTKHPDYVANREKVIRKARTYYRKNGFKGPIWDTEIGMGDRRGFKGWTQVVYTGDRAAGMLARTYIDAMRLGVYRTYWYGWDSHVMGLDMIDPKTKKITAAGVAFQNLQGWMVGKQWIGCTTKKKVRTCRLQAPDGARSTIVYATSKTRSWRVPAGANSLTVLNGSTVKVVPGQVLRVDNVPRLVVGA